MEKLTARAGSGEGPSGRARTERGPCGPGRHFGPTRQHRDQTAEDEAKILAEAALLETALSPWTGDLDGMVERNMIRIAIPYGIATYFLDGPAQKGPTYDLAVTFEQNLKKKLGLKDTDLTMVVVPARRERTLARAFVEGFLTKALNPKVSMFYLAAFPQFIPPGEGAVASAFLLVCVHAMLNALWFGALILLLGLLGLVDNWFDLRAVRPQR